MSKGLIFQLGVLLKGLSGIREAFETGKGKVVIRSKYEFDEKTNSIIITEIPF